MTDQPPLAFAVALGIGALGIIHLHQKRGKKTAEKGFVSRADDNDTPAASSSHRVEIAPYLEACHVYETAQEDLRRGIRDLLASSGLPGWPTAADSEQRRAAVSVERLGGAMTNMIFRCMDTEREVSDAGHNPVLLRIYGEGTEAFFSREMEISTFGTISSLGFGPQMLHQFDNGRVEQWVEAKPLDFSQMREEHIYVEVARALAQLHASSRASGVSLPDSDRDTPILFPRLRDWYAKARVVSAERQERDGHLLCGIDVAALGEDIDRLEEYLAQFDSPVVLAHNDCQAGNILWDDDGGIKGRKRLELIDFEYSAFNFRGFDLGNHFNEWMYDYYADEAGRPHEPRAAYYPDEDQQRKFCREYLTELNRASGSNSQVSEEAVTDLVAETNAFALASSLFWVLWGLLSAAEPPTPDFSYDGFTTARLNHFWRTFTRLSQNRPMTPGPATREKNTL